MPDPSQLEGELRLDWRSEGLACEIIFPPGEERDGGHTEPPVGTASYAQLPSRSNAPGLLHFFKDRRRGRF